MVDICRVFFQKNSFLLKFGKFAQIHFWQILVLEIWTKIPLTNEIAGSFKKWYLKKELNDKVYFWHADKHQSFLQVKSIIWMCLLDMSKVPEITSWKYLCNISWKTWRMKMTFCLLINVKGFFKLILSF